jgi:hypothetical protein
MENGTYEHPFDGFNQTWVNYVNDNYGHIGAVIDPFPWLYFAPGNYDLGDFASHRFALPGGWGMYGRSADYVEPAQGDERALFIGGLDLYGSSNVLDSIQLKNNGSQSTGINITGSSVYMNNISVGVLSHNGGYNIGIYINSDGVTLNASQVYGYNVQDGETAKGISVVNGELTLGSSNTISAESNVQNGLYQSGAYGISANFSTVNIIGNSNTISAESNIQSEYVQSVAYGISADYSTVNISGSFNDIRAKAAGGDGATGYAYGDGINADNSTINISGSNNNISAEAAASGHYADNDACGIKALGSTVNVSGSDNSFSATATGSYGWAKGIEALASTINFTHTATGTTITGNGPNTWGIYADKTSHLQIDGTDVAYVTDYLTYITFINNGTAGSGKKIEWEDKGSVNW